MKTRLIGPVAAAAVLLLGASAHAAIFTMTDANSSVQINADSDAGVTNWTVSGHNQIGQQWFWYRIGATGDEAPINTLSAATVSQPTANTLTATYANSQLRVRLDYTLRGGTFGTGISDLAETVTLTNLTAAAMDLHFFAYSDYDVAGTPAGDAAQLGKNLAGFYNELYQAEGLAHVDAVNTPGANHAEVSLYSATLNTLRDGNPTTLSDTAGPLGPGDLTGALQWDLAIPAGTAVILSRDQNLSDPTVPEPASLGLLALGAIGLFRRRRA